MKLYLICLVLSLASLASAGIPAVKIATMIYGNGQVIAKGFDLRYLDFKHYTDESGADHILSFNAAGNNSKLVNPYMILHKNYTDELFGVAIETYEPMSTEAPDEKHCREIASKKLVHLIQSCYAHVHLRELTWKEKLELYIEKMKSKITGTKSFAVYFDQMKIRAVLADLENFNLKNSKEGEQHNLSVVTNAFSSDRTSMSLSAPLAEKSFTIKSQPKELNRNCSETDLVDLKPADCSGRVQLTKNGIRE